MAQEVYEWKMLAEAEKIYTGDNSQVRNMIIERSEDIEGRSFFVNFSIKLMM